ncbi:MAG: hypothetical protein QOG77_89 [Solirubrobacteraceae bacterium]|jgi:hypothetical protein|nr:hypothetical protein [Solirubrobacteraceae bacterium]
MSGTPIYRAPMRARDVDVPAGAGAEFGLQHAVVGIGEGSDRAVERLRALPEDTFVWTRTTDGRYWLGRIAGSLRRDDSAAAHAVGLRWVRPTWWLKRPFGEDEAPPGVVATFARGGRNLQQTHDEAAERRTAELWTEHVP